MSRAILTLSGLQHAAICPGAAVLPRVGSTSTKADLGSALHEFNAICGEHGARAALDHVDDIADRWGLEEKDRATFVGRAFALDLDIPEGAVHEMPLCLRADGTVEPASGAHGAYDGPEDMIVAGTIDILFATPEPIQNSSWCPRGSMLWAADLKTGDDSFVAPIARNWQARVSALLGARWTGAETVVPAIVFPGPDGGVWDVPMSGGQVVPLGGKELERIEEDVRRLHATVTEQAARVADGVMPRLVTGAHCTYCPARAGCPAHVSEVRALVTGHSGLVAGPLTHEQAIHAAGMLGPAQAALNAIKEALVAHVETFGPLELPDGKVFGPRIGETTTYSAREAHAAMVEEFLPLVGEDGAVAIADTALSTGKSAIYGAIATAHERGGIRRQKKLAFERIVSKPGVATTSPSVRFGAFYPKE